MLMQFVFLAHGTRAWRHHAISGQAQTADLVLSCDGHSSYAGQEVMRGQRGEQFCWDQSSEANVQSRHAEPISQLFEYHCRHRAITGTLTLEHIPFPICDTHNGALLTCDI